MNIEDPDSLGLSPDEEDKILRTDDTQDTNMTATSGASSSEQLAEVKLLSPAILCLKRLDKLEETLSTMGKGKGKGERSSREPQSQVPAKKTAKGWSRSTSEQNPSTLRIAKPSCKTLPNRVTRVIVKARMKY